MNGNPLDFGGHGLQRFRTTLRPQGAAAEFTSAPEIKIPNFARYKDARHSGRANA